MKQIVLALALVLATAMMSHAAQKKEPEKDWCLLGIESECHGTTTLDRVEKVRRLKIALEKGEAVYSQEELQHFQALLEEANEINELLNVRR